MLSKMNLIILGTLFGSYILAFLITKLKNGNSEDTKNYFAVILIIIWFLVSVFSYFVTGNLLGVGDAVAFEI